jgi:hypothetical protein
MQSSRDLIQAARHAQARPVPKWAKELIHDLASRLRATEAELERVQETATREVTEARALLTGPEDSDTFMNLPRSLMSAAEDGEQRPLGKGVTVEFRTAGEEPGEGTLVSLGVDQTIHVHGLNHLVVVPVNPTYIQIERR